MRYHYPPRGRQVDFRDLSEVRRALGRMVFVEIKTANQDRVQDDFAGFFFSLTEKEVEAAEMLGTRHKVALYNAKTGALRITSVREVFRRSRSANWGVSVQL